MSYTNGLDKPSDYFNTVLYTGNNTDNTSISGLDFQPDWVWLKARNQADYHYSMDSVRGALKPLFQNDTSAEANFSDSLKSFNTDGFTLGTSGDLNAASQTMVAWNWKAGTSFTNDASSTGIGSIDSTGSVNTDAGFSIISYTGNATDGATIAHGLGVTPDVIIAKSRASVEGWGFFHSSFSSQEYMFLNTTSPKGSASTVWNALPGSAVFTVGSNGSVNASGTMIAYCFAEKQGYSKFGSYTGNGNADGTFVYTGFKPAFVICKITSGTDQWVLYDNKRDTFNVTEQILRPNTNGAEGTESGAKMDLLSNGFKLRGSGGGIGQTNNSGSSYIYMAFAENPFVTSTGVPATAR